MAMKHLLPGLICAATLLAGAARAQPADPRFEAPPGAAACIWAGLPADMIAGVMAAKSIDDLQTATAPLDANGPEYLRGMAVKCGVAASPGIEPAAIAQHIVIAKSLAIM